MKDSEKRDLVSEVHSFRQAAYTTFKRKWLAMSENSKFLRLTQYSDDQLLKMQKQNRVPYVLDYLNASMNTYIGIQRDRRTEIFYYPVEKGDEVRCEVLNAVKDSCLLQNNFVYLESDVFTDGLTQKLGAISYEWSKETNKNGALKMFRLPPRQLMWDLNSQEFPHDDATWISHDRFFSKAQLKLIRPEMSKVIDKMNFWNGQVDDYGLNPEYLNSLAMDKMALLTAFFKKDYEIRFFIQNSQNGVVYDLYYKSQKEADKAIRDLLQQYDQEIAPKIAQAQMMPPPPPDFKVINDKYPVIVKTEVCADTFFSSETIDEPFYPISFYHPFFHDGDWWCPLDIQKDGQRYVNKMFSMADHWIGSMSKGLLLADGKASKDEVARVKNSFSTTGGVEQVRDSKAYQLFESRGPNPQLFTMLEIARQNLEDNSGGRNFQGKKETASESGVAVRTRIEQGGMSGFIIYDNLRRWKIDVGTKMAWYLTTYMTMPSVVRIEGEELVQQTMETFQKANQGQWFQRNSLRPGIGFLKVNTDGQGLNSIEGLKVDLNVDEARWSISKQQSILQEISIAMQSNPNLAQTFPPETMLEFMNLPFSVKQEARQRMKQLEQMKQAIDAANAIKPPAVSASLGDIEKLDPQTMAQFLEKYFGIQVNPENLPQEGADPMLPLEAMKSIQGMKQSDEKHQADLALKQQDMAAKQHDVAMKSVQAVHAMSMKERIASQPKNNNGKK